MSDSAAMNADTFLAGFFGDGNRLRPFGPEREMLAPWVERVRAECRQLVLPRVVGKPPQTTWYALCRTARDARVLREELLAAVGPSYSDFRGVAARLDPGDPVEAAILAYTGTHAFKLCVVNPGQRETCAGALAAMLARSDGRPVGPSSRPRSRGRVMLDFELALREMDAEGAEAAIAEMRAHGHLDAWNLQFLEIQRWERVGDWSHIVDTLEDGTLYARRRPKRVTQALLRAIYHVELTQFEGDETTERALDHMRAHVLPRHGALFDSQEGMPAPEVAHLYALRAQVIGPPPVSNGDPATEAFTRGDIDTAFELLKQGGGGAHRVALMLRCAREIGSLAASETALEALYALDAKQADTLREQALIGSVIDDLEEICTTPDTPHAALAPTGWLEWMEHLVADRLDDNQAHEIALRGAREWSPDAFASRPGDVATFAELLANAEPPAQAERVRLALPHLLEFFLPGLEPLPAFKPVFRALGMRIVFAEGRSAAMLRVLTEVTLAAVRLGLNDAEFREVITEITDLVVRDSLPLQHVDWSIDLLEALLTLDPARSDTSLGLGVEVQARLEAWRGQGRLPLTSALAFNRVSSDFDLGLFIPLPESVGDGEDSDNFGLTFSGQTLALYSLNTRALARVAAALTERCEGVRVLVFDDKAGGRPALKEAARTADIFLIVTASATHAATNYIKDHRDPVSVTLQLHAQGSASMLRCLYDYAGEGGLGEESV